MQAPATATVYDKNGKPVKKGVTHSMDCRACGGKGWRPA